MTYFLKTLKAIEIHGQFQRLEQEKQFSIELSANEQPQYSLSDRIYNFYVNYIRCRKIKRKWNGLVFDNSRLSKILEPIVFMKTKLSTDGTFENYIFKSIAGFFCGVVLTYLLFAFLLTTAFDITHATFVCALLAPILCLGLAFSSNARCIILLFLPQFFSRHGRQALIAYAFFLAATGPAKNTFHNMNILSDSLSCSQEQLKTANRNIIELIKMPFNALSASLKQVIRSLKRIIQKVKDILVSIKRLVVAITSTIKNAFDWLMQSINFCNKKLGTPYERCMRVLNEASDDCKVQVIDIMSWMCYVTYAGTPVCFSVKWIDYLCDFVDWIVNGENIFGVIRKKMREFERHLKTLFYVSISVKHSYSFETNSSKTFEEVSKGVLTEIRDRTAFLVDLCDQLSFSSVFMFFSVFMLYRVVLYRYRFMSSEIFDNRFITNDLVEIDWRRTLNNRETILPLNRKERTKYVTLFSPKLIRSERLMFAKSMVFLSISTFKLVIYMLLDYSLYWVLYLVRTHGRIQTNPRGISPLALNVNGEGVLADILKSIISSFKFVGAVMDIDTLPCLPDPIPPDIDRYKQIIFLMGTSWIFAFCQPFGLRLRHHVMCIYHPNIAKKRSIWLYNNILRRRLSFEKYARRELRRKFSKSTNALSAIGSTRITLKQKVLAICPFLTYFIQDDSIGKSCLVCGSHQSEGITLHYCPTPGCIGTYCSVCYNELNNLCTICKNPLEYGDVSDMSEEKDSSEDETLKEIKLKKRESKKEKRKMLIKKRNQLLPHKWFNKKKILPEEYEQVLPLYRKQNTDGSSEFSDVSEIADEPVQLQRQLITFNEPCRQICYASKNIFQESLPIFEVNWCTQTGSHLQNHALEIETENFEDGFNLRKMDAEQELNSEDTSDDVAMKPFIQMRPKIDFHSQVEPVHSSIYVPGENSSTDNSLESGDYYCLV